MLDAAARQLEPNKLEGRCGITRLDERRPLYFQIGSWYDHESMGGRQVMILDRHISEHRVFIEDDGLFIIEFRGPMSAADMGEILREHDGKLAADRDLFVLSDLRALTTVEPTARHALGTRPKGLPGYCVAYMVPNYRMKMVMDLVIRAANVLTPSKVVHRFFDDAEEARRWLREMRRNRHPA